MNELKFYEVRLFKQGSDVLTHFLCKARDQAHAREQAISYYPKCTINSICLES